MKNRTPNAFPKIPLVSALVWIVSSTLLVACLGYAGLRQWHLHKKRAGNEPRQRIVKILQTGPEKEVLSTLYLAELMGLSIDRPITARSFDLKMAAARLRSSPVIEQAKVSLTPSNTLLVDYVARRPIAWLYDYVNIGVDANSIPFPIHPFFSPKKLPEIFLGEAVPLLWNKPIVHPKMQLALTIHTLLSPAPFAIKRIDVGQAFAESYGKRQIVLVIEESFKTQQQQKELFCVLPRVLRLSTKDFRKELGNYIALRDEEKLAMDLTLAQFDLDGKTVRLPEQVIDLRVANMAFIR
jgi:hypothetical protein